MTDWQSPETIALDYLAIIKVTNFAIGVYIWDWIMSLPFEYRLVARKNGLKAPLTVFIYFGIRIFAFTYVILTLVISNVTTPTRCNLLLRLITIFANIAMALSSLLVAIRTIAIWRQNKLVIVVSALLIATSVAFYIHGNVIDPHLFWEPLTRSCASTSDDYFDRVSMRPTMAVGFTVDAALIAMMLVGTWMYKGAGNLWRLVLNQGIIWAIVALLCYLPTVVLLALDLNAPLNSVTDIPTTLGMILCTTAMQRKLSEYMSPTINPRLPSAALSQSIKFARRPMASTEHSQASNDITEPTPAFIALDPVERLQSSGHDLRGDTMDKHAVSTIV